MDRELNAEKVILCCEKKFPGYQVPRSFELRIVLPRNSLDKLPKRVLREEFWPDTTAKV